MILDRVDKDFAYLALRPAELKELEMAIDARRSAVNAQDCPSPIGALALENLAAVLWLTMQRQQDIIAGRIPADADPD